MSSASLPISISYLQGVVDDLATLDADSIDESIDTTSLCLALKRRIAKLSISGAEDRLRKDKEILGEWLSSAPSQEAAFVVAFMTDEKLLVPFLIGFEAPKGWKEPKKKSSRRKMVQMDIPPGFRCRREGSALFMQLGEAIGARTCIGLSLGGRTPSTRQILAMATGQFGASVEEVSFGAVTGLRLVREGATRSLFLKVDVTDIWVSVEGDVSLVEPYLHTLSITEADP